MAFCMDVLLTKSWNLSHSRLNSSSALNGKYLQGSMNRSSVYYIGIPFLRKRFMTLTCSAKAGLIDSEFAAPVKISYSCNFLHCQERKTITDVVLPRLKQKYIVRANDAAGNSAVTSSHETAESEVPVESSAAPKLSHRWRDIQGANDWKGLLSPLDPDLKAEMIKYGEFAQLCYDAFDYDSHSDFCGSCSVNPRKLLKEYGLRHEDYKITQYLYATSAISISLPSFFRRSDSTDPWSTSSNWIGFVAVSSSRKEIERLGRRDIVVAWRGTVTQLDWLTDLQIRPLIPSALDERSVGRSKDGDVRVETGFLSLYTAKNAKARYNQHSAREQLLSEIQRLRELYKGENLSITLTGHSLGAALALLSGYDLAESRLNLKLANSPCPSFSPSPSMSLQNIFEHEGIHPHEDEDDKIPITVYSFAGPRVGNSAFCDRVNDLGVKVLRIVNVNDVVPKVPGLLLNEKFRIICDWIDKVYWTFSHVGVEFALNNTHSPFLEPSIDPSCLHNLEAYMHLIDGYTSFGKKFKDVLSRDYALVNKNSNFLKTHLRTPGFWRQDKDKGLIKHPDGKLKSRGRYPEDIPPYSSLWKIEETVDGKPTESASTFEQ